MKLVFMTRRTALLGMANLLLAGVNAAAVPQTAEVWLDWTPLQSPVAAWTTLNTDGTLRQVRYISSRGVIVSLTRIVLKKDETAQLFADSRAAVKRKKQGGNRPAAGSAVEDDLAALSLHGPGEPADAAIGPVSTLDAQTQNFLTRLLHRAEKGEKQTIAPAFLRGEPIAADRLRKIQQDGKIVFLPAAQIPKSLQNPIRSAVNRPCDFIALTREQADEAARLWKPGTAFYLSEKQSGYTMRLYIAANSPAF